MDDEDRPPLGAHAYEVISMSLYDIEKGHRSALRELRIPYPAEPNASYSPPPPKRPETLRIAIRLFARELFIRESNAYPPSPEIAFWLTKLSERVTSRVLKAVEAVNSCHAWIELLIPTKSKYGLDWHGLSVDDLRQTIKEELDETKRMTLARYQPAIEKDDAQAAYKLPQIELPEEPTEKRPEDIGLVEYRQKLLADYKAVTGDPSNMKLYQARNSGIHKPDFYAWIKGTLPERSKVTKSFEAFLMAKRPPIPRKPTT